MDALVSDNVDILIVDDDKTVVIAMRHVLEEMGNVRFALNAEQAFNLIGIAPPDLILLDVDLPGLSGIEFCKKIKSIDELTDIPILFITSNTENGFEESVFDSGGSDYIAKPLKPRVVAARVRTHLAYRKAMELLAGLARTDGLTGLMNKSTFYDFLDRELRRCRRHRHALTVVMVDVDEFKKFNDSYGHMSGDVCIKKIASVISDVARRAGDFSARFGGEEFCLALPYLDRESAIKLLDELRVSVYGLAISHADEAIYKFVSVSIGFYVYDPDQSCMTYDSSELLAMADKALYRAKSNGRNRVEEYIDIDPIV